MSGLTFITNEENETLKERFVRLIKDCKTFDCLVGYFYLSGFHEIYKALENTEKIRILIGIGTSEETYNLISEEDEKQLSLFEASHFETKRIYSDLLTAEFENSEDSPKIEEGIIKFKEWLKSGKLEIRAFPSRNLHAKLYIFTFKSGDRDIGRVITGSSNFSKRGLIDNLEFNVELKREEDYFFALEKFNSLWENSVDVSDEFITTVDNKTYLNENITPYELYLKFLYEYFRQDLSLDDNLFIKHLPEGFKELEYQRQAVINAKKILEEYGGVFISDVVGLGKTYIATMLASQLEGRTIVIAPPALLDEKNPGSWPNAFFEFHIPVKTFSTGKLDDIEKYGLDKFENVIIDEAHRFRNESTINYERLARIVRGKRVILVTATPYNNSPKDILNMISLFQNKRKSTIPGVPDIEAFFTRLDNKLKKVDKRKDPKKFIELNRENAKEIREKVLRYLMVRRTRNEIEKYFSEDLKKNNIKFPKIEDPKRFYYEFDDKEDEIFDKTLKYLTQDFTYARYTPLLYLKHPISELEKQSQANMGGFMKVLLVKRLESSFYAFKKSLERFIESYEGFVKNYENGNVYVSKKYSNKIFELLEQGEDDKVEELIDKGEAKKYSSLDFKERFIQDIKKDLEILKEIKNMWASINEDPKLNKLISELKTNPILSKNKVVIFTESKETAEYLVENINKELGNCSLLFTGDSDTSIRDKVIENFDAKASVQKDDYRILVATEVLSEGVNLHRSNVVINYDIPWNPTRLIQRVGRINRIDTPFDKIYTFNFFPTKKANNEIQLEETARAKVNAFLTLLGGDASILTEGEPVESHELFDRLTSKKTLEGDEEDSDNLKYFAIIKNIRDNNPDLFEKIKKLPKKARTAKKYTQSFKDIVSPNSLVTYFRKGKLDKFIISNESTDAYEIDFLTAAKILESEINEKKETLPKDEFYKLLLKNKEKFNELTDETIKGKIKGIEKEVEGIVSFALENAKTLTEEQEEFLRLVKEKLYEGSITKTPLSRVKESWEQLKTKDKENPLKIVAILQRSIPSELLASHLATQKESPTSKREVILSLFLKEE
jgi:superfamily II DNA or RNA helicase/HKD family nuclease